MKDLISEIDAEDRVKIFDALKPGMRLQMGLSSAMSGSSSATWIAGRKSKSRGGEAISLTREGESRDARVAVRIWKRNGRISASKGDMSMTITSMSL